MTIGGIMFRKALAKVLSHSDTIVRKGAKDAGEGKQNPAVDAFAHKGRDAQQKQREEKRK
jgi:hypothetical protein